MRQIFVWETRALIAGAEAAPAKLADAAKRGFEVWDEATFLKHAHLLGHTANAEPIAAAEKALFGWYFEEYHVKKSDVVRDGFSRTDIMGVKSTEKGFAYHVTPLFIA